MKIVVVGSGTLVGDALVDVAGRRGHEVRALSPGTGVDPWAGQDLLRHLRGAHAVIDVAVAPPADEAATLRFHRACTTALLTAGTTAGVAHHVVFSLTGSGSAPRSGLFRAKAEQEALVRDSALATRATFRRTPSIGWRSDRATWHTPDSPAARTSRHRTRRRRPLPHRWPRCVTGDRDSGGRSMKVIMCRS